MKKILGLILLVVSVNVFGQTPTGYQYRMVREKVISFMIDSSLHIPSYCGAPSGLRSGSSTRDGALAMDTCNNLLYIYSSGAWSTISGTNIYNSNGILQGNRTLTGLNNTYYLNFDSLNYFVVGRNAIPRVFMNSSASGIVSPDGSNSMQVSNSVASIAYNTSANYLWVINDSSIFHKRASYEGNLHSTFYPYSLVDKSYVDSVTAAAAPTLQTVTTAGHQTTNSIEIKHNSGISILDGSNQVVAALFRTSSSGGANLDMRNTGQFKNLLYTDENQVTNDNLMLPNTGSTSDTIATLRDIRAGGGGFSYSRNIIIAVSTGTDANITAAAGTAYSLSAATLSTNRTIDMTNLNTNGDYIEFDNQEAGFTWTFTGQTVYDAYENSVTVLLTNTRYIIRRTNGKLKIIN